MTPRDTPRHDESIKIDHRAGDWSAWLQYMYQFSNRNPSQTGHGRGPAVPLSTV